MARKRARTDEDEAKKKATLWGAALVGYLLAVTRRHSKLET